MTSDLLKINYDSEFSTEAVHIESLADSSLQGSNFYTQIRPIIEKLRQTLENHRGEKQIIVTQDFPDPDALSSAWAYQLIAQQYDIESEIVYAGTLSHQENIALVRLTGIPAKRLTIQALKEQHLSDYQGCVLVDGQGTNSQLFPVLKQANIPVVVVVDHHSKQGDLFPEFIDLRTHVGSTATLLTQYIQSGLLQFNTSNNIHIKCATALMHGVRSDTNQLKQAGEADFIAAGYLSKFFDAQLLNSVLCTARSRRVMDVIEKALSKRIIRNNFSIAGVGYLRYEDRDAIPQAADFLVTEENIHTALVYGIVHHEDEEIELVIGSLRTNKLTLDPDEFIKEALGKDTQGRFFGGGRNMAGGFEIPLGFLGGFNDKPDYTKLKWEVLDQQIKQKLLHMISPDGDIPDH
jgi:nanoRNase/pAp phosphatase (c-di-AMP/oligoRNAs hydrolase)